MNYYNYKYKNNISGNVKPENTHSTIENSTASYIYFVDNDDNRIIKKLDISDGSVSVVESRTENIRSLWHDRDNSRIYGIENGNDSQTMFYIELDNNDNVVGMGNLSLTNASTYDCDIFKISSTIYVGIYCYDDPFYYYKIYSWTSPNTWNYLAQTTNTSDNGVYSFVTVVGTDGYFLFEADDLNRIFIEKFDSTEESLDSLENFDDYSIGENNIRALSYDGEDILYFVVNSDSDSKNYLFSYSISGDSLTKIGIYNIALMLDRNTASGILEKGFHITEPKIYQISEGKAWLYHIATLNTTKTIQAITDNYVILE